MYADNATLCFNFAIIFIPYTAEHLNSSQVSFNLGTFCVIIFIFSKVICNCLQMKKVFMFKNN